MQTETVAKVVSKKLKECKANGKKQSEIAIESGFKSSNMITYIKQGKSKLPPEKAPDLAKAIGLDAKHLMRLAMNEKWEGVGDFIFDNLDKMKEIILVEKFRQALIDANINYDELTENQQKQLNLKIGEIISQSYPK